MTQYGNPYLICIFNDRCAELCNIYFPRHFIGLYGILTGVRVFVFPSCMYANGQGISMDEGVFLQLTSLFD